MLQPSLNVKINAEAPARSAVHERIDLANRCSDSLEEIERLYREAYDDHNFVYLIAGHGGVVKILRVATNISFSFPKMTA